MKNDARVLLSFLTEIGKPIALEHQSTTIKAQFRKGVIA